ncbi:hypothetical protein GCM10027040_35320 [Halomonas shantousis]
MSRLITALLLAAMTMPVAAQTTLEKAQNEATDQEKPDTIGVEEARAEREIRPCKQVRVEVDREIQASGAKDYSLEIVPEARIEHSGEQDRTQGQTYQDEELQDGDIVGSCDSGEKRIIFRRD